MKIAVPVRYRKVSPVLDTAERLEVFNVMEGRVGSCEEIHIGNRGIQEKARIIADNARMLICGALSNQMAYYLAAVGLEVYPWIMGDVDRLIGIFAVGNLPGPEFSMPGCKGRDQKGKYRFGRSYKFRNRN